MLLKEIANYVNIAINEKEDKNSRVSRRWSHCQSNFPGYSGIRPLPGTYALTVSQYWDELKDPFKTFSSSFDGLFPAGL